MGFFLTPFVVHSLGETRYGVWTLVVGITGYYGLLDLGVASGMTQYLTRYLAAKDIDKLNTSASTGFVALSCIGFLVFVGSLIVAFSASWLFRIQAASPAEVTWVLVITGTSVAMQFVFFTYSAVFTAVQRFDLSNVIGISTRILSAVATVICLNAGYGLVGLSLVVAGTNLIDYLIRWRVALRLLPDMKISLKLVNRESFREVMTFGTWNFVSASSGRLISYTDALVIAAFMPVAAVAPFAIAANLRSYFDEIFVRVGFVFFPAVTELDARGDQAGLRQVYLVSSKFMLLGSILLGSIGIFSARDFFRLWVGSSYAEPTGYPSVATIFYLLLVGSMIAVPQRIGYQVLLGTRRVKLLALLFAAEGVCNLVISLALVRSYGLIGVALGTLIPALLFQGFVQPLSVCQSLQISLRTYCRQVLMRPAFMLGALVPLFLLARPLTPSGNWVSLGFTTSVMVVVSGVLMSLFGLNRQERDSLLIKPATRVLHFFGRFGHERGEDVHHMKSSQPLAIPLERYPTKPNTKRIETRRIVKIGFVLSSNSGNALPSTRISVLNMFPYLRATNYEPHIVFEPTSSSEMPDISGLMEQISNKGIEIVYFQKVHGRSVLEEAKKLSAAGVKTVYGVCDLVDNEMAQVTDATIVVTEFLKGLYDPIYQPKIHVVHDGIERPEFHKDFFGPHRNQRQKGRRLRAVLVTSSDLYKIPIIDPLPRFINLTVVGYYPPSPSMLYAVKKTYWTLCSLEGHSEKLNYVTRVINKGFKTVNWDIDTVYQTMLKADVGIIPVDMNNDSLPLHKASQWQLSSENRLTLNMAMGIPVVASPVPAYKPVIEHGKNGYIAATRDDWVKYLKELRDPELREMMGQCARDSVINRFSKEEQARKLVAVFDSLCAQGIGVRPNIFSNPSCFL